MSDSAPVRVLTSKTTLGVVTAASLAAAIVVVAVDNDRQNATIRDLEVKIEQLERGTQTNVSR